MNESIAHTRDRLRARALRDGYVTLGVAVVLYALSASYRIFNVIVVWFYEHQAYQIDSLLMVLVFLLVAGAVFTWRRRNELLAEIMERERIEGERAELMHEVKALSGLLPICAWCKRIRDDKGYWNQLEAYISSHSEAEFTHGICPDCLSKVQPTAPRGASA